MVRLAWLALSALLPVLPAFAQPDAMTASVDRATIHVNESVTYLLRAEGAFRGEPDFSGIEQQFDVLDRSRSTRVQIVNGQAYQLGEWQLQLMPRGVGQFTLPPAELEGLQSNRVEIEVLPAVTGDAPGDIFLEIDVSPTTVYVQSQLIYTLRIFRGVSTGRATLTTPVIQGGEAIVETLGEDREYQTVRDGRNFIVRERRFAVFPQQAGLFTIDPVIFEAVVVAPSGYSSVQRYRSDSVQFKVEPPVAPPPEYPAAAWLPASGLSLSERWSEDPARMTVGAPLTRTVVIEAEGVLETQLPELDLPDAAGVRQFADQPELTREAAGGAGFRSRRTERFAVIAQQAGPLELGVVELPWWNVAARRWEVARLEPRVLTALPSPEQTAAPPPNPALAPEPAASPGANVWRWISVALAAGWLLSLAAWWRSARGGRPRRSRAPVEDPGQPRRAQNRRLLRQLREACRAQAAVEARRLLLEWAALRFDAAPPLSLGALAERLPPAVAAEIAKLEASLYGPQAGIWDGHGLENALRLLDTVARPDARAAKDDLLPLYR